jgi:hypothetical protein
MMRSTRALAPRPGAAAWALDLGVRGTGYCQRAWRDCALEIPGMLVVQFKVDL